MLLPQTVLEREQIGVRNAFWWCSPSIPWLSSYFFYSDIFINKILAHLILAWHLFLRISKLTQAIQVPPAWLLGKDNESGIQTPVGGDLLTLKYSSNTGIWDALFGVPCLWPQRASSAPVVQVAAEWRGDGGGAALSVTWSGTFPSKCSHLFLFRAISVVCRTYLDIKVTWTQK